MNLADRVIGPGNKCFIIAEAGVNHNGSFNLAKHLVDIAVRAGADAVKFQTFKTENLILRTVSSADYQKKNTGEDNQFEILKKLELPYAAFVELKHYCDSQGILFLSTPADRESATFLNELVPVFKIGSGELNNHFFLRHVARFGKPMIISTGMSTLAETVAARDAVYGAGNRDIIMLHCTTGYPTPIHDVHLRAIETMNKNLGIPIGYSDHAECPDVPLVAIYQGACVIEKHFTYDKNAPGPDHTASLTEQELRAMVQSIRLFEGLSRAEQEKYVQSLPNARTLLGCDVKQPTENERKTATVVRKTFVAACDIRAGTILTEEHIETKRTGGRGISGERYDLLIGRNAACNMEKDYIITTKDVR